MGGLEAVDLVPSIFLDQNEDNSAKKILFWIELLHTLRSRWVVPPCPLKVWWESSPPAPPLLSEGFNVPL